MNREFRFCKDCCSEFFEFDSEDCHELAKYKCNQLDSRGVTQHKWINLDIPDNCIMKLEYMTLTNGDMEIMSRIARNEKSIDACEKAKELYKEKIRQEDVRIKIKQERLEKLRKELKDKLDGKEKD